VEKKGNDDASDKRILRKDKVASGAVGEGGGGREVVVRISSSSVVVGGVGKEVRLENGFLGQLVEGSRIGRG
jgi:hypothetical protein